MSTFWATDWKIGLLFIAPSGHTGSRGGGGLLQNEAAKAGSEKFIIAKNWKLKMKRQKLVSCWSHQGRRGRTVWPDCYIIVQYLAMCNIEKHCPNFCQSRSKICQILKKHSTILERLKI